MILIKYVGFILKYWHLTNLRAKVCAYKALLLYQYRGYNLANFGEFGWNF